MTDGERLAHVILNVDWAHVVLKICARKRISKATLARQIGSDEQHIRRLATGDTKEPRFFRLAFKLLDEYSDVN